MMRKKFEIWLGYYNIDNEKISTESEKVGEEMAGNFKLACFQYELRSRLKYLDEHNIPQGLNEQDCIWYYSHKTNSHKYLGKYYRSKKEADASFNQQVETK